MNTHIPAEYGGSGLGVFEGCLIAEEIAWGCTGIGTAMEANTLAEAPVIVAGHRRAEEAVPRADDRRIQARRLLRHRARTPARDVAGIKTLARSASATTTSSTAQKMWITNGSVADWYFVLAYTDPSQKHRGMSALRRAARRAGHRGRQEGKEPRPALQRHARRHLQRREGAGGEPPRQGGRRLQDRDGGLRSHPARSSRRPPSAWRARAMEHAIQYANERKTFGVPIARHQAISFMIADMAMDIEAARLLVWQAAWTIDQGRRNTREAAFAKAFARRHGDARRDSTRCRSSAATASTPSTRSRS